MLFHFTKKYEYPRKGPIAYETNEHKCTQFGFRANAILSGWYESRVSGPNTAFAVFKLEWGHFSNIKFGYELKKHFNGKNAALKARAWLNWLLNNPPKYANEWTTSREKA